MESLKDALKDAQEEHSHSQAEGHKLYQELQNLKDAHTVEVGKLKSDNSTTKEELTLIHQQVQRCCLILLCSTVVDCL